MYSKIKLPTIILASLVIFGCSTTENNNSDNVYGYDFETAKISYQISGSSVGTSEVLIKGEKKLVHNRITQNMVNGEKVDIENIFIQDGPKLYTLDVKTKTGSRLKSPVYNELKNISPSERKERILRDILRDNRDSEEQKTSPLSPEKQEKIAGQTCDLYKVANMENCVWQGISLKTVASLPDYGVETTTVATNIELNKPISDSEFDLPQGYQITELN